MLVVMQEGAAEQQIQSVIDRMVDLGFTVHRSTGVVHTVLGGVGPKDDFDTADFEVMDGVKECHRISILRSGQVLVGAGEQVVQGQLIRTA